MKLLLSFACVIIYMYYHYNTKPGITSFSFLLPSLCHPLFLSFFLSFFSLSLYIHTYIYIYVCLLFPEQRLSPSSSNNNNKVWSKTENQKQRHRFALKRQQNLANDRAPWLSEEVSQEIHTILHIRTHIFNMYISPQRFPHKIYIYTFLPPRALKPFCHQRWHYQACEW